MRRANLSMLAFLIFISCAHQRSVHMNFTEKFEGLTQLVLASQTINVDFTDRISKRILGIFPSNAQVKVTSNVSFDFYIDFDKEGYKAEYDQKSKTLYFSAPPIRVKKPVINASSVSFPETGLLVNEEREALAILENLTDRFIQEGETLLTREYVREKCHEKCSEFLKGLSSDLGYKVESVELTFGPLELASSQADSL
ncbi:MAG: hypothetical protein U5R06_10365 [candidate division KSB1 bacterium]|nr:hypothetical protein [candidate division KSB1 bacterium]